MVEHWFTFVSYRCKQGFFFASLLYESKKCDEVVAEPRSVIVDTRDHAKAVFSSRKLEFGATVARLSVFRTRGSSINQ